MSDALANFGLDNVLGELDEEQVDEVQLLARGSLATIYVLFKLTSTHGLNNDAYQKPVDTIVKIFDSYKGRGTTFNLRNKGESFFINNAMVKLDSTSVSAAKGLAPMWDMLGIGGLTAKGVVEEKNIRDLLGAIFETMELPKLKRWGVLVDEEFGNLKIHGEMEDGDPLLELKLEAQRLYSILAIARKEFNTLGIEGRFPPLRRMKRLSQRIIDLAQKDAQVIGALSTYYGKEHHEMFHPINVMVISVAMGMALKMGGREITALAIGALLHDIGMNDSIGQKGKGPVPDSVELLMRFKSLNEQTLQWTVTADELGMYSRYVPMRSKWYFGGEAPGIFSRIITIAHRYERWINGQADQAVSPHTAVLQLIQDARKGECDLRLVKAFVQKFGLFPAGTVVRLTDGTFAVVLKNHESPALATMPTIRPIPEYNGNQDPEFTIELADPGVRAKIAAVVQPSQLRINPLAEIMV